MSLGRADPAAHNASSQDPLYVAGSAPGELWAHFGSGASVKVQLSRARRYPGLDGCAPPTLAHYLQLASLVGTRRGDVIDAGCGVGVGARRLTDAFTRVVGIDQDVHALAFARHLSPKATFVRSSLETLADVGSFHAAIVADVLGHLTRVEPALLRLRRRLLPESIILVAEPSASHDQQLEAPVRRAFTRLTLEGALRRSGYSVDRWLEGGTFLVALGRPAPELAPERLGRSLAALQRADYDTAMAQSQPLCIDEASPLQADALLVQARVMVALGKPEAAAERLEVVCALSPNDPRPWSALSYLALRSGDAALAETQARQAVRRDPLDPSAVRSLAAALDAVNAESAALWRLTFALSPDDPLAAERVAALHAADGDELGAQRVKSRLAAYQN
jgi:SAM-dependent methyltransferase